MRLHSYGVPLVILSHRKREFIESCIDSITHYARGITDVIIVDDSGDFDHHRWLDDHGLQFTVVDPQCNAGYLAAMNRVWEVAETLDAKHVLLWEEDFLLTKPIHTEDLCGVMLDNPDLAQLNLQRQSVYRIERRFGYMESHRRRGYGLQERTEPNGIHWVSRRRPFTTNPGLLNAEVLRTSWPSRYEADRVPGGAEPAMSQMLERMGWTFGWYGAWNTPFTQHIGTEMKTGKGY